MNPITLDDPSLRQILHGKSIRIRDSLHGSLSLSAYEAAIIGHPYIQRLRYIRQLGFFHLVFPGATHSRFEHSLGVMHLATCAYLKISDNQRRLLCVHDISAETLNDFENHHPSLQATLAPTFGLLNSLFSSPYALATLRTAALLHDIGHSPYSHCSEKFLPSVDEVLAAHDDLPDYLKEAISQHPSPPNHGSSSASHEIFTLLLAWYLLEDMKQHFPPSSIVPHGRDVLALLSSNVTIEASSPLYQNGAEVLRELLSGEVDADRMDYLRRDSQHAGVSYGSFDLPRLLDSLHVVFLRQSKQYALGYHLGGMHALEDYLKARGSMFKQLYFHKTSVACEAMLQHISRFLPQGCFPAHHHAYAALCDHDLPRVIKEKILAQSSLNQKDKDELCALSEGLFFRRNLWKRWCEVSSQSQDILQHPDLKKAQTYLKDKNRRHEMVVSMNFFTQTHHKKPVMAFPMIVKHKGMPVVKELEELYGEALHHPDTYIVRVYVENHYL
ncbi:MAG: HD domain-containing protein [Proteobacteria bacterium]|nr:HD domain-containing protein [Pseudomonadota bacterium]